MYMHSTTCSNAQQPKVQYCVARDQIIFANLPILTELTMHVYVMHDTPLLCTATL